MGTYDSGGETPSNWDTIPVVQVSNEGALIEKMENVVLKSDENLHNTCNSDGHEDEGGVECSRLFPLRPYAGDCSHYVRTGTCKFGLNCRYNHPVKRTQQSVKVRDDDSEKFGPVECKYYSTPEGCKYGKSCRYYHPGEDSAFAVLELNFLGLPMRPGQKECVYFMRYGSCGYGSLCVYHHPDPNSTVGMGSPNSVNEAYGTQADGLLENGKNGSLQSSGTTQPGPTFLASHRLSGNTALHPENHSLYESISSSPRFVGEKSEWNGHQSRNYYSSPTASGCVRKADFSMQVAEFPERPGQPECDYFLKTGDCKFKFTCRFHHPKDRVPKPDEFVLSDKGLPLRPGRSVCRHYERLGLCKFGQACLFDHPVSYGLPTFPELPTSRTVEGHDEDQWEN